MKRIVELDLVRLLAAISVVMIHTSSFYPWFYKGEYVKQYFVYYQVTSYAVPLFICISGLLLSMKYKNKKLEYLPYLKNRIENVLIPYIIASLFYMAYSGELFKQSFVEIIVAMLLGKGFFHLYFIILIFQLYVIFPIFKYATSKIKSFTWFLPILLGQVVIEKLINMFLPSIANSVQDTFFAHWVFIFLLGCYIGENYQRFLEITDKYINGVMGIIGTILVYKAFNYYYVVFVTKAKPYYLVGQVQNNINMIYTIFILMVFIHFTQYIKGNRIQNIIIILSKNTFSIYLYHMIILRLFKYYIELYKISVNNTTIVLIISTSIISTIILSLLLNKIPFGYLIVGKNR
ncbi:MAG: acyltransferase [Clostridiaceae bacterium]